MSFVKENKERLATVGISAKNDEQAREKMLKFLKEKEMEGLEDEESDTLLELCETFGDTEEVAEVTDEVEEVTDEVEEVAEEETPAPKKATTKPAAKPVAKPATPQAPAKKPLTTATPKVATASIERGRKLDINSASDVKMYDELKKLFPEKDYNWKLLTHGGVTIFKRGKNANFPICGFDGVKIPKGGQLIGNFYFNTFRKREKELAVIVGDNEIFRTWSKLPYVKEVTVADAVAFCSSKEFKADIASFEGKDKKLGENREKMEKQIEAKNQKAESEKATATPAPKKVTKVAEPIVEEVEEVEEVAETPAPAVKKAVAKPIAKPAVKKPAVAKK